MMGSTGNRWQWTLAGALALALSSTVTAAPFVPADEGQVLERLPDRSTPQYRDLRRLQAAVVSAPNDVAAATALANAYYRISRSEGDPRFLGYAQAALTPWWKDPEAPSPVLVMRATILQSSHEFRRALADLDKAILRNPRDARAILVRATVLTVQGQYDDARADCARLQGVAPELYVVACTAGIDAVTGKAQSAKAALERSLAAMLNATPDVRGWFESLLGEIAQRQGDPAAEKHFRTALAADPRDLYTLSAYSDWLLDQQRAAAVVPLVQNDPRVDTLLLRLALAQKTLQRPEAESSVTTLRARFDASRARGDTVHRREEARFQLRLNGDPKLALRLAEENWNVQREPADLRILAEVAQATGDAPAREKVRQWLAATGLEYPAVAALVKSGEGRGK
jgi:tetratricopeptide (TPR) repeat protein